MVYLFNDFTLDPGKFELREQGKLVAIEPQVFFLLKLLIENRERMVSKEEIIDEVWHGRCVSDASIASRVKSARKAVKDDGNTQGTIRTVYGQGFRFVAETSVEFLVQDQELTDHAVMPAEKLSQNRIPSIVVLPFQSVRSPDPNSILAEAISHDLIQALSRLRWLFVIARGSAFRFRTALTDVQEIGKALGIRYVLAGSIENLDNTLVISTELSDTRTGGVVWADRISSTQDSVHQIRTEITARVVSSLEVHIPFNEARTARLCVSEHLDSWSNFHLGLQHMYRFKIEENTKATGYFERAVAQDPRFARAYAGLSFTSFQSAFLKYKDGRKDAALDTRRFAERSVELDPLDPFANFTLGRSFMLEGDLESSANWLDRAITLNPNYSQGHYTHAFTDLLSGQSDVSHTHIDTALALSPLDPFVYAMLAARSLSFVIDGDYERAAEAGEKAARSPGAHFIIDMIAVIAYSLNQNQKKAQYWADNVRTRRPDASQALFFGSFPFSSIGIKHRISDALARYGF